MPDVVDAEAAAQKIRENLEQQLRQAQERAREVVARANAGKEARWRARVAKRRARDDSFPEPSRDIDDLDDLKESFEIEAAQDEVDRIRQEIADLPPTEDILSESDPGNPDMGSKKPATKGESDSGLPEGAFTGSLIADMTDAYDDEEPERETPVAAEEPESMEDILSETDDGRVGVSVAVGGGSDDAPTTRNRTAVVLGAGAIIVAVAAFFFLQRFGLLQPPPGTPPNPQLPDLNIKPTDSPVPPISGLPEIGSSFGFVVLTRTSGSCSDVSELRASLLFENEAEALTVTRQGQVPVALLGTLQPSGEFKVEGPDHAFDGTITGTGLEGTWTATTGGCTEVYEGNGNFLRPFLAGEPLGTVLGNFEFKDLTTGEISRDLTQMTPGGKAEAIVGSANLDISKELPIRLLFTAGDRTLLDTLIDGPPATVCSGPSACSAPVDVDPAFADPNLKFLGIATGSQGKVLAVTAPNGLP